MTTKAINAAALVAVVAVAGYWYWSPFLAIRQIQTAAQASDVNAFNERVDYPRVRESLKGQFAEKMGASTDSGNPLAALGSMLGVAVSNQLVDATVRPEIVMQAMRIGKFGPFSTRQTQAPSSGKPVSSNNTSTPSDSEKLRWTYERPGVDKLIAYAVEPDAPDAPNEERTGVVFERSGFVEWKLTGFRLPVSP